MSTFKGLLERLHRENKGFVISFGEKFSMHCKITEMQDDYIRINLLSFDKSRQAFAPTPNHYFIPIHSILFLEEHKA